MKQATGQTGGKWAAKTVGDKCLTKLNNSKENCTFSKTHINEVIRFLANTARYSPPTFFTMESTKYKTGSFSVAGAWSNRKLNKFRKQQGLKATFQNICSKYNMMIQPCPFSPHAVTDQLNEGGKKFEKWEKVGMQLQTKSNSPEQKNVSPQEKTLVNSIMLWLIQKQGKKIKINKVSVSSGQLDLRKDPFLESEEKCPWCTGVKKSLGQVLWTRLTSKEGPTMNHSLYFTLTTCWPV